VALGPILPDGEQQIERVHQVVHLREGRVFAVRQGVQSGALSGEVGGGKIVLTNQPMSFARAGPYRQQPSAISVFAVLHGMNAQRIAAFFGEAHSEIANAETLLTGRTLKSLDTARARLGHRS
jgi:hypothetical protein